MVLWSILETSRCSRMILSAFGSSGLFHCLGICTRAVIFLPPACGCSCQYSLLSPSGYALFSHWLNYSVPFPCIFHGISIFAASLAQEHQAPAWLFSCSTCCGWVMFPGPWRGPDLAHVYVNRDTRTHTHVHTCKPGTGWGWQAGTDFAFMTSFPSHPTRSAVPAERM